MAWSMLLKCFFCVLWKLSNPHYPLGVRHPIEQCGRLTSFFLHLFRCRYHSWESTCGARKTSRCSWSGLVERVVFIVFVVLPLVLINYKLWICNETLIWLSCLTMNFYFWIVMIINISYCFSVVFGILLVGENSIVCMCKK